MAADDQLETIYDEHAQALFGLLMSVTKSEADTRDILQDLFIKLAREPGLLCGVRNHRAFLLRVCRNLALDQMRRRATHTKNCEALAREMEPAFVVSDDPDQNLFRRALSEALDGLPTEQRTVLHLKLWEGLTFEEIAEVLSLSANTAASRFRYGLDKLRARLRHLYEEIN